MFGSWGKKRRERVLELRCPVTVPREIGSLSRMNDDGTNIRVSQQRRDLVFGDWASAAIFVPWRVWIGEKLLHYLLRCYFPAALGEHRPQSCKQLHSGAELMEREKGKSRTDMPARANHHRHAAQFATASFQLALSRLLKPGGCGGFRSLMIRTLSAAHRASLRRIVEKLGIISVRKVLSFFIGLFGHILRIILRLAIVRGNLVLPRMPRIFGQNGS